MAFSSFRLCTGAKSLAALFLTLSLGLALSPCVQAAPSDEARKSLEHSVTIILDLIKNPGYADKGTRPPLRTQIEKEVYHVFDFEEFSSRTVGANWRSFSTEEKKAFSDAFASLLLTTYLDKVDGYNGERIQYTGEVASPANDRVEVRTIITLTNKKTVPVAYRMLPKGNNWRVYDVLIENISLVKNYRTQFQDILSKGTPQELTLRVREKAEAMREKSYEKK